jgi:tetratricopeptide (TPR) repeat protein
MPSTPAPDRFTRLTDLFRQACTSGPDGRTALLDETRSEDPELAAELEALLAADDTAAGDAFLRPLPGVADAVRRAADDVSDAESAETGIPEASGSASSRHGSGFAAIGGDLSGQRLGDFELQSLIARGGMGAVYLARQTSPDREVAIKLLRDELPSSRLRDRFQLEADVLARLQHPAIAAIHASGTADGRPWLAMEYIAGARSITQYAAEADLSIPDRVRLLRDVVDAIRHAHQRGVIHRDLKPANLLVGEDGRVRVIDFGVARADELVSRSGRHTNAGELLGTLAYMSPEQCAGEPEAVDVRSDVYSLGVVLHELVAGRRPLTLEGLSLVDAVHRVSREGVPELDGTVPGVDRDLRCITGVATALDQKDRYQSADALIADLDRWLAGEPITARPPGPIRRVQLFARRRKGLTALMGAAAFAAACVGVVILFFGVRLTEQTLATRDALDRSERMLGFLVSVLSSGSDQNTDAPTRDIGDLMELASRRAGVEFADDPEAEYRLRQAIGLTMRTMGEADEALAEFDRQAELAREIPGATPRWLALAEGHRASALSDLSRMQDAEAAYRRSVELYEAAPDTTPSEVLAARQGVAVLEARAGRRGITDEIRRLFDQSRDRTGRDSYRTNELKSLLAVSMTNEGRAAEAEEMLREVMDDYDAMFSGPHPERVSARNNYGWALINLGRFDEAIAVLDEAATMSTELFGRTHPRTTWIRGTLLDARVRNGEGLAVEAEARELLADRIETLGDGSAPVALSESLVWRILADARRHEESLPLARSAHEHMVAIYGEEHLQSARTAQMLALTLARLGRPDEALPMLEEVVELVARLQGAESRETALAANELGIAYAGAGRWDDARAAFVRAKTIYDRSDARNDPERIKALGNLGRCLLELGRTAEARPILAEACTLASEVYGENRSIRVLMEASYAEVLAAEGATEEARRRLTAVLPRLASIYPADHPRRLRMQAAKARLDGSAGGDR